MQWRPLYRVLARRAFATANCRSKLQFPSGLRTFQSIAVVTPNTEIEGSEVAEVDEGDLKAMAQTKREVKQLQQVLGLVPSEKAIKDVIFVCIDCEAFEFNQKQITEIGVSVLDTRAVKEVDPGDSGQPWFDLMKHIHLRPIEHRRLINRRFVKGCPDDFNFGESTFIHLKDAGRVLDRIFCDPTRLHEASDFDIEIPDTEPHIALVGHDLRNDTDFMKRLNFEPKHIAQRLDTQVLSRSSKAQSPGLAMLLSALSVDASNLHNAGNDAAYTLQALIGLAVQDFHQSGSVTEALLAAFATRAAERLARRAKKAKFTVPAPVEAQQGSLEPIPENNGNSRNGTLIPNVDSNGPAIRKYELTEEIRSERNGPPTKKHNSHRPAVPKHQSAEKTRHERKDRFRRDKTSPGK